MEGRRSVGRPKKTWSKVEEEDRSITEDRAEDSNSGGDAYHVQPQKWETRDVKRR